MAVETIILLDAVVDGPAHLVGYSDGGNVSLLVALERPDLVRSMVLIGANFHHDGLLPFDLEPDSPVAALLAESYAAVSHGVEHFPVIVEKTLTMFATEPTLTAADLARIPHPTLVLAGDDDLIALPHTCASTKGSPTASSPSCPARHTSSCSRSPTGCTPMCAGSSTAVGRSRPCYHPPRE